MGEPSAIPLSRASLDHLESWIHGYWNPKPRPGPCTPDAAVAAFGKPSSLIGSRASDT